MAVEKVYANATAGGLKVNSTVVVKEQQAVIANTTITANSNLGVANVNIGDLPTVVNSILVALKAHGLLASS